MARRPPPVPAVPFASGRGAASVPRKSPDWEPVLQLDEHELPAFIAVVPQPFRDFVEALSVATQTPPDLPAMLVLAALSAACAARICVVVNDGYAEPVNIFVLVVLDSANRKSSVYRSVVAPIQEHEQELRSLAQPIIAEVKARRDFLKKAGERANRQAAKAYGADRDALRREAEHLAVELASIEVPATPCLLADDVTLEKLGVLLSQQGGRLAVLSAEGGGILDVAAGRYSSVPNLDPLLKGARRGHAARRPRRPRDGPRRAAGFDHWPHCPAPSAAPPRRQSGPARARLAGAIPLFDPHEPHRTARHRSALGAGVGW
jgi:replicative DNA helicase